MKLKKIISISAIAVVVLGLLIRTIYLDVNYATIDKKLYRKDITYLHIRSVDDERFRQINKCTEIDTLLLSKSHKHHLYKLMNFPKLRDFVIMQSEINKVECEKISSFSSLENLEVMAFTDFDFEGFDNKTISSIWINNSNAKNIESLYNCISLESLRITNSTIPNNCIVKENSKYIMKDSSVFESLDKIKTLEIYVDEIQNISGILQMDSLEKFHIDKNSISDKDVKSLENKGVTVTYYD